MTNKQRAAAAKAAIKHYLKSCKRNVCRDELEAGAIDLVADILHYVHRTDDFLSTPEDVLRIAKGHFESEGEGKNGQ